MQENRKFYTVTTQYITNDPVADEHLLPSLVPPIPPSYAAPAAHYGVKSDPIYGHDKHKDGLNKSTIQYYAKDPVPNNEHFLVPHSYASSAPSHVPHSYASSAPSQVPHSYASSAPYGVKSDPPIYGRDKHKDGHDKDSHIMKHGHKKGHYGEPPEVNNRVQFFERDHKLTEFDRNGKHEVHAEEIFTVDAAADGFIQKKHQTFDKWETAV